MASRPKIGAIVTVAISLAAIYGIGKTFISNASPYVDVDQAMSTTGEGLHLLGSIDKTTLHTGIGGRQLSFDLVDAKQKRMHVDYDGEAISNIDEADKVVAVGGVHDGRFVSNKLLIKCPSKYDDSKGAAGKSA